MYGYYWEKFHVNHLWELKGQLTDKAITFPGELQLKHLFRLL